MCQLSVCAYLWKTKGYTAITQNRKREIRAYQQNYEEKLWFHIHDLSNLQHGHTCIYYLGQILDQTNSCGCAKHQKITFCVIVEGTRSCRHLSSAHVNLKHINRIPIKGNIHHINQMFVQEANNLGCNSCLHAAFTMFITNVIYECQRCDITPVQCVITTYLINNLMSQSNLKLK